MAQLRLPVSAFPFYLRSGFVSFFISRTFTVVSFRFSSFRMWLWFLYAMRDIEFCASCEHAHYFSVVSLSYRSDTKNIEICSSDKLWIASTMPKKNNNHTHTCRKFRCLYEFGKNLYVRWWFAATDLVFFRVCKNMPWYAGTRNNLFSLYVDKNLMRLHPIAIYIYSFSSLFARPKFNGNNVAYGRRQRCNLTCWLPPLDFKAEISVRHVENS